MTAHAKLSASGSSRWLHCPGSVQAESDYPEQTSIYAAEGTAAHALAEYCLTTDQEPEGLIGKIFEGFEVTDEMAEGVAVYTDYVRSLGGHAYHEVRVDFSKWVPVGGGFGTSDAIVLKGDTLYVVDLKFGRNKVEATENSQAQLYALGAYEEFNAIQEIKNIVCVIVQPRIQWIDEWSTDIESLLTWGEDVRIKALATQEPDAPRNPSEKACHFCKAKAQCPALAAHIESTMLCMFDRMDATHTPDKLTDEQLKTVFDNTKLVEGFLEAVATTIRAKVEAGTGDKFGLKLVAGRTTRKWRKGTAEEVEKLLGDQAYESTLLSPAKAEKVLGSKRKQELDDLVDFVEGQPILAPVGDNRQAITHVNSSVFDQ